MTALKALTLNAAIIAGAADRLGSLETGKIANLLVTDGDLFDEKMAIKHVFVDGRPVTSIPRRLRVPPSDERTTMSRRNGVGHEEHEEHEVFFLKKNILRAFVPLWPTASSCSSCPSWLHS